MKKILVVPAICVFILFSAFSVMLPSSWKIADGYSVKFTGKNASGEFTSLKGDIQFNEKNPETSKIDVTVDVSSIDTGIGLKTKHARSDMFFDEEKFPVIKFTSNRFSKTANGYEVTGTLDMHGVQKQITIPFTFAANKFIGSFTVNRIDYSVGTTSGMSYIVGTDILIELSVPVLN
jgi:polyisoprenoid-binding protein YceI